MGQSAHPSRNTCPRLAHLQNNSECQPGQKLALGSDMVTVPGKEMERVCGVVAQTVTPVAMGSSAEGFGVIHTATRLYSQKSMACYKNK